MASGKNRVEIDFAAPAFKTIASMTLGQVGYVADQSGFGDIILRAKGDYVLNMTTGDVVNVAQTVNVFTLPAGIKVSFNTV